MKNLSYLFLFLIFTACGGNTTNLELVVTDCDGNIEPGVDVKVYNTNEDRLGDSNVVYQGITRKDGTFKVEDVLPRAYYWNLTKDIDTTVLSNRFYQGINKNNSSISSLIEGETNRYFPQVCNENDEDYRNGG